MDSRFESVKCNLCGADDFDVLYKAKPPEARSVSSGNYAAASFHILEDQVVRCRQCGLVYINPRPKSETIVKGYSDAVDEAYVSQFEGRYATFRQCLKEIEKACSKRGRVLDVGCAAGIFLKAAKDSGWETAGVEPSRWLAEWGNNKFGVNIKPGTLEQAHFPDSYFDVVTLWDVLEHVPDPAATLREINRILKPGGVIAVNYPNIGSNLARAFGRKWWFLLSVHLYYFVPKTIRALLEKEGFSMLLHKRHFQRLQVGYLVSRVRPYSKLVFNVLNPLVNALRLAGTNVPYYASQSLVLARKKN